jgi:hypothetical protein
VESRRGRSGLILRCLSTKRSSQLSALSYNSVIKMGEHWIAPLLVPGVRNLVSNIVRTLVTRLAASCFGFVGGADGQRELLSGEADLGNGGFAAGAIDDC